MTTLDVIEKLPILNAIGRGFHCVKETFGASFHDALLAAVTAGHIDVTHCVNFHMRFSDDFFNAGADAPATPGAVVYTLTCAGRAHCDAHNARDRLFSLIKSGV